MGRYEKYTSYSDTDVVWFGELPKDWIITKIGYLSRKTGSGKTPRGGSEVYSDSGVLFLRSQNIYDTGLRLDDEEVVYITEDIDEEMSGSRVKSGDILLNITGASIGRTCIVPANFQAANVNQHVCIVRIPGNLREYVSWYLKSAPSKAQIDSAQNGAAREGLNYEQLANIRVALPSCRQEQTQIANFLDHETAKIDTLIEKQQRLIELLKEKRQAVINHAATKGIDAKAELQDTGISWMGEIPAHWTVLPVKRLFDVSYGLMGEIDRSIDSGTRVISLPNVKKNGTLDLRETSFRNLTPNERRGAVLTRGDLLFNWRNGSIDHVGKTALFDEDGEFAHVSFLLKLRALSNNVDPHFYWLALNGLRSSGFFGSSKLQVNVTYNQTELRCVPLPVPPIEEQKEIVATVLQKYEAIDATCAMAEKSLAILQERRTALISAAVTGKIDVRNWEA